MNWGYIAGELWGNTTEDVLPEDVITLPLPDPLAGEGRFWWTFCVCTVRISELLVSPFLKRHTKGKERAQEIITSHSLGLELPRQSAFFLPSFRVLLVLFIKLRNFICT